MTPPPLLVLAVGNASRGDDGLGPALLARLRAAGVEADGDVELLEDFQLQVEHALDLDGRRAVLFADAAHPQAVRAVTLERLAPDARVPGASHALRPQAVLRVACDLRGAAPPAWLLAMPGACFDLGDGLSRDAERVLDEAVEVVLGWIAERRG